MLCLMSDMSQHVAHHENIVHRQLPHQRYDVSNTSATQFCLRTADPDAGEFHAYFSADDRHFIVDDDDDAACYNDYYDDNYQVCCQYLCVTISKYVIKFN